MYRLFREALGCEDSKICRLELTYFASAVMTAVYLRLGKEPNREQILDRVTRNILEKSVPQCGEQISFGAAAREYQIRYAEYDSLLSLLFNRKESSTGAPGITLLLHVFECVTQSSAREHMIEIAAASMLVQELVFDHVDFVKKKL